MGDKKCGLYVLYKAIPLKLPVALKSFIQERSLTDQIEIITNFRLLAILFIINSDVLILEMILQCANFDILSNYMVNQASLSGLRDDVNIRLSFASPVTTILKSTSSIFIIKFRPEKSFNL